jgi:ADP-ribose pyrophosphatase YjhB (NUDIX family)
LAFWRTIFPVPVRRNRFDAPLWGLVAGGVEDDETLDQALRREVREETGLEVEAYDFFGTFSDPSRIAHYPDGNIMQVLSLVYRVNVGDVSRLRTSDESTDLRFFHTHELPPVELVASHRPIIERYLSGEVPPFLE